MSERHVTLAVPINLLEDIRAALNDIPNTRFDGEYARTTYELAAALDTIVRSAHAQRQIPREDKELR